MIILEYLFWIIFIGYCYFMAIRLKWVFEKVEGHPFWLKPNAGIYHFAAGFLFFVALVLLLKFHVLYLLIFLLTEYVLIAGPAVKVNERGIMTNAFLARWPDIVQAKRFKTTGEITVITTHPWQRIRLQVPVDKEAAFRKMLAAKGIQIVDAEAEKSAISENNLNNSQEGVGVEHLAQ